ncbi:hypothetical protein E3T55_18300 [Cryobacterium frigoriphilum]|uniref:DUF4333 domain-containing protein n=1 Tax=Cryobacterium frigoriphilum TaxID=1259150 RepID=A0A4R8ZTU2_9MICO|nr:hypothetical protein [Cryobacterium frigoriphilum]TFD45614.1 hypothetical protein E3T55_18300 [Cryobacterium frigoriphilum]
MMPAFSPRTTFALVLVLASLGSLTACSSGSATDAPISVDQLVARTADTPVSVAGLLYQDSTGTRLCGAVMESFPVQCGKPWAELVGLDIDTITGTTTDQGITWKEGVVLSVQRADNGSFTVLSTEAPSDY